jgi:hypothetical protein
MTEHTDAMFTHGACPDCFKKQMDEIKERKVNISSGNLDSK